MTTIFPPWYSRFVTLALRKLCYPTLPTDIFTTQNPGGHVIRSDQWVSPPDNPPTRKEKEREPGYEVNLNLLKRLPKLISCVFFLSRASWLKLVDGFVILLLWLWMCKWICRARPHWKKKSTQAKLKKHKRFLIFLCCTLLFMQGYTAWTPILILSFSVLMHTT